MIFKSKCTATTSIAIFLTIAAFVFTWDCKAKPVNDLEARLAVKGLLEVDSNPFGIALEKNIKKVESFGDNTGVLFHVVYIQSGGFVVVSADDLAEPIIAICSEDELISDDDNPLWAIIRSEMPKRIQIAKDVQSKFDHHGLDEQNVSVLNARQKNKRWKDLINASDDPVEPMVASVPSITEVWVSPFVLSKWSQSTECGYLCYNYYTPNNYVSGCVATAFAQVLRFYEHPTEGIGQQLFSYEINGSSTSGWTRGGDGSGGPYNWSLMSYDPDCTTTLAQRQQIGALCYDAGISVEMNYTSQWSGAWPGYIQERLLDTFGYSDAVYGNNYEIGITDIPNMLNTNLDAGKPVIMGISGSTGGHAIITDGYGYSGSTPYHHFNMGWAGSSDAWYNIPNMSAGGYTFTVFDDAVYNIYVTGEGEIISGRVLDLLGAPLQAVTVTAQYGASISTSITNAKGIYACTGLNSNKTYTLTASKDGYVFSTGSATTGTSTNWQETSGNRWGINLTGTIAAPVPVSNDVSASVNQNESVIITLSAIDDGYPDPLTYILTSLPVMGILSDPIQGEITSVPYSLTSAQVNYVANPCAAGQDIFEYKANDGGTAPNGGDSNIAMVTVTTFNTPTNRVLLDEGFETTFPLWTIVDGGANSATWTTNNPKNRESFYLDGKFMIVDSDYAGTVNMDEQLISPVLNCSSMTSVTLSFSHKFLKCSSEIGDVDISTDGTNWTNLNRYQGATAQGDVSVDITNVVAGHEDVQIRWHYYNANYEWYWAVDNIKVSGISQALAAPIGDIDCDCEVDSLDLVHLSKSWLQIICNQSNNFCSLSDISQNGMVDLTDFAILAQNWLDSSIN